MINTNLDNLSIYQDTLIFIEGIHALLQEDTFQKDPYLADQLHRASISIILNLAEGIGRGTTGYLSQFLKFSKGSLYEVKAQIDVAFKLGLLNKRKFNKIKKSIKILQNSFQLFYYENEENSLFELRKKKKK